MKNDPKDLEVLIKKFPINEPWDSTVQKSNMDFMSLLVHLPEFLTEVSRLRENYKIPPEGFPDTNEGISEGNAWLMSLLEADRFDDWAKDVGELQEKVKAIRKDPRYFEHLRLYILYGRITAPATNYGIHRPYSEDGEAGVLNMAVYGPMTAKEQAAAHTLIELLRNAKEGIQKRYAPKKNLLRDIVILNKAERLRMKIDVGGEEYRYSTKDIVAEVFEETDIEGDRKNAQTARKALLRIQQELKDRLGWDNGSVE